MPTVVTSAIGSGRDYATAILWEADTDNNLVSLDEQHDGEVYDDYGYTWCFMAGAVTDSTRFRRLIAAAGDHYDPIAGTGCEFTDPNARNLGMMRIAEDYGEMHYLGGINSYSGTNSSSVFRHQGNLTGFRLFLGCTARMPNHTGSDANCFDINNGTGDYRSCLAIGENGGAGANTGPNHGFRFLTNNITAYNCGAWGIDDNPIPADATRGVGFEIVTTGVVKNCWAFDCPGAAFTNTGTASLSTDYNADDDGTATGTNSFQISGTVADELNDTANDDFRVKDSNSEIKDAGDDLSATFTESIDPDQDHESRGSGLWNIGPYDEIAVVDVTFSAGTHSVAISVPAATVVIDVTFAAGTHSMSVTQQTATVVTTAVLQAAALQVAATMPDAQPIVDAVYAAAASTLAATMPDATAVADANFTAGPLTVASSMPTAQAIIDAIYQAAAMSIVASMPGGTAVIGGDVTFPAGTFDLSVSQPAIALQISKAFQAGTFDLQSLMGTAALTINAAFQAGTTNIVASMPNATAVINAAIQAGTFDLTTTIAAAQAVIDKAFGAGTFNLSANQNSVALAISSVLSASPATITASIPDAQEVIDKIIQAGTFDVVSSIPGATVLIDALYGAMAMELASSIPASVVVTENAEVTVLAEAMVLSAELVGALLSLGGGHYTRIEEVTPRQEAEQAEPAVSWTEAIFVRPPRVPFTRPLIYPGLVFGEDTETDPDTPTLIMRPR